MKAYPNFLCPEDCMCPHVSDNPANTCLVGTSFLQPPLQSNCSRVHGSSESFTSSTNNAHDWSAITVSWLCVHLHVQCTHCVLHTVYYTLCTTCCVLHTVYYKVFHMFSSGKFPKKKTFPLPVPCIYVSCPHVVSTIMWISESLWRRNYCLLSLTRVSAFVCAPAPDEKEIKVPATSTYHQAPNLLPSWTSGTYFMYVCPYNLPFYQHCSKCAFLTFYSKRCVYKDVSTFSTGLTCLLHALKRWNYDRRSINHCVFV